jgi:hypothetical protein
MDELKNTPFGKTQVVTSGPSDVAATFRKIRSEHRLEIGHFLTAFTAGETLGIDCALFCFGIEELAPRVEVYHQFLAVDGFLMTTQTTLGTLLFPALTHDKPPGSAPANGPARKHGLEVVWKERLH